jgi:glutathione synthase/RimK-type ligase-like ATP-grasp enzyme
VIVPVFIAKEAIVSVLIVTDDPRRWPFEIPNVQRVSAWSYLMDEKFAVGRGIKVFNLCRSYKYQSLGYYVSLLAEARGHRPLPNVTTIQDLKSAAMVRLMTGELADLITHSLASIQSDRFTLSVYFGRNVAKRYDRLSRHLSNLVPAPLFRAEFAKLKEKWQLRTIRAIAGNDVPESHRDFVIAAAEAWFAGRHPRVRRQDARFDLAILVDPNEPDPPSDEKALKRILRAAKQCGFAAELITREDFGRIAEFDALFIRETTAVEHHTYRFARQAAREGLVVIDDPQSIMRCTNKVFLAELLARHKLPMPRTMIAHRDNIAAIAETVGFPCVLKKPDSAFSRGVTKVDKPEDLVDRITPLLAESDLVIAQEFLPTTFDWRIGVLDGRALYACKYFMARGHWQIVERDGDGKPQYGKYETMPVELAPKSVVRLAVKTANLIGDGLYGVDIKQSGDDLFVIEINDNPNLDAGVEDAILGADLYERIMNVFLSRVEARKSGMAPA